MTFTEAITDNIARCTDFRTRSPRSAYWWYALFVALGAMVTALLDILIFWPAAGDGRVAAFLADNFLSLPDFYINVMPISTFWYFLNFLPTLAVGIRRMNDQEKPAWWYVAALVVIIVMSFVSFSYSGEQTSTLIRTVFNPDATNAEIMAQVESLEEINVTQNILSAVQTLPSLIIIIWMATRGTIGPNRNGEDPVQ